ncbi:hypothetical protein MTO96_020152 [Rhipicephalus appendiculatus]
MLTARQRRCACSCRNRIVSTLAMSCHNIRGQATLAERLCDELRVMERRGRWVGSTVGWAGEVTDVPAMLVVKTAARIWQELS